MICLSVNYKKLMCNLFIKMMIAGFCLLSSMAFAGSLYTLDIYGTNKLTANQIQKKYAHELIKITKAMTSASGLTSPSQAKVFAKNMKIVISGIKKTGDFIYVNLSPVIYPNDKTIHFTLDVVEKKAKKRLGYFKLSPTRDISDPEHLISTWIAYENLGFSMVYKTKEFPTFKTCPGFHCLFGFEHPKLKRFESIFVTRVPRNQTQLIDILRNDKDENKRAAAAFLLSYIKNGKELVKILTLSINDSSSKVRNNVMRVLAETLQKVKVTDFPTHELITALDFPATTDRNKALFVISSLTNQPGYAKYFSKNAGPLLLQELKLTQPNVHNLAYIILKQISGKHYGERDYIAWEKWIKNPK